MGELGISRRRLVGIGAVGALGVLLAPEAVLADGENREEVELLRWDLVQIVQGVVLAGGIDVARDAASGDLISLTGSGGARPEKHKAPAAARSCISTRTAPKWLMAFTS